MDYKIDMVAHCRQIDMSLKTAKILAFKILRYWCTISRDISASGGIQKHNLDKMEQCF